MKEIDEASVERGVSDRLLRAFVAAAAAESFTAAARVLGVGQPAVSHAIKQLELSLGVELFERGPGRLSLTAVGERLSRGLDAGYRLVDDAVATSRVTERSNDMVTLSVSTALATYWLMPRLATFKEQHPDVELSVITSDTDDGVGHDGVDLWVPLGTGPWPGTETWRFADERIAAVASPAFVQRNGPVEIPNADLLHLSERYGHRYDWEQWFLRRGHGQLAPSGQRSNDYSIVVHAALEGQGVALGWLHIVEPLISAGRLVAIGDDVEQTDSPFLLVSRRNAPVRPAVALLRTWLLDEATEHRSQDSPEISRTSSGTH